MKIKVSEATGAQLDWVVAKCEDKLGECTQAKNFAELCKERKGVAFTHGRVYSPSTDWAQAGPIIEREKIELAHIPDVAINKEGAIQPWVASYSDYKFEQCGPTPLVAAMRCYVVSKLGDEVEVPDELT